MTDENQTPEDSEEAALWTEFDEAESPAADEAADDVESDQEPQAAEPEEEPENTDPWAQAPEELKTQYQQAQDMIAKLEQSDRSNRGRLSALQRQINELTSQRQQAAESGDKAAMQDSDDDFKALTEDYPEIAKPIQKMLDQMKSEQTRLQKELGAIGAERRQQALDEQATLLADEHPDWVDVGSDPGFMQWLQEQPRHIQEAAARNGNEIVDYREAADVVGRYKQFKGIGEQTTPKNSLADKRQRQLKTATSAKARGPGAKSGIPEDGDPEQIWKQFEEMERRQSRA
jgi:predicted RNA-binding Zn ribbon-like protein